MTETIEQESATAARPLSPMQTGYWTTLAMLTAGASCIQFLEAPLPRLLPWLKPGLSNALVLYALVRVSGPFGLGVVFFRTLVTGLLLGTLFSPPNLLSFAGGLAAVGTMSAGLRLQPLGVGLSGVSVLGALANNVAQLLVVDVRLMGHFPVSFHLLVMIWVAIPSGILVARLTQELLRRVPRTRFHLCCPPSFWRLNRRGGGRSSARWGSASRPVLLPTKRRWPTWATCAPAKSLRSWPD